MMGPLVIGGCRIPTLIDKQETVHPNDFNFQKEMALWESEKHQLPRFIYAHPPPSQG